MRSTQCKAVDLAIDAISVLAPGSTVGTFPGSLIPAGDIILGVREAL